MRKVMRCLRTSRRGLPRMAAAAIWTSLLGGCGAAGSPSHTSRSEPPPVWIGMPCSATTRGQDRQLVASPADTARICVDRGAARLDYRPDALRIIVYRNEVAALLMQCAAPQQAAAFFRENQGKRAILVVGDTAISEPHVSLPMMGCGWQSASDLQDAITQCERIATAWSRPTQRCWTLCDQAENAGNDGICIAHKRTP
ncbi:MULTISPECIES: hypothetical protein [Xanthomonas]|uniref:hypothetical protein n=1 Tax=Xanthomonas TaxID=338 RepID=UPI001ADA5D9C|nr:MULTISPECIES: hypothetical protein [unclassified Xanthomonas]MBO9873001.1 hypothetical protein [Xanthomonas sp. D-93]WNH44786.1 hypothetical protein PG878_20150 [Xanthomonas sp. A6251]